MVWVTSLGPNIVIDALQKFVEWYLGVDQGSSSETTRWRFHTADWVARSPTWALVLVAVAVFLGVLFVYHRDARRVQWSRRLSLIGLRVSTFCVLAVLLLQLSISFDRVGLPLLGILIDTSGSMRFQDNYQGTEDAIAVASLTTSDQPATRLALAQSLLIDQQSGLLKELAERFRARVFTFDKESKSLLRKDSTAAELREAIASLKATGSRTALFSSTRRAIEELRAQSPTAFVVLTDGISTEGDSERLSSVIPSANRSTVPIYVIAVGAPKAAQDIEVTEVLVDEVTVVDQAISFSGEVRSSGFKGRDAVLELRNAKTSKRLAAKPIRLTGEQQTVELSYTPTGIGEFDLMLGIVPQGEELVSDNNYETRHLSVRSGRIRVLLVDRLPRYEFRYIKHLLERDESTGAFELDTVLLDADPEWTATDQSAAKLGGRLPASAEHINSYDVVILGDVDPTVLSVSGQSVWRDFVRENGGGLVLVAGPKYNPHAYRGSTLEPLFPLDLGRVTSSSFRRTVATGVRAEPTISGSKSTRLFRFGASDNATSQVIAGFPPLQSMLNVDKAAVDATVLAAGNGGESPVVLSRRYGAGQVVLHASDDLWLWRFRSGDETHGRYWLNLVRYLARSSLLGRDRSAVLVTDREVYDHGEPIAFHLRFRDTRERPPDGVVEITLERDGGVSEVLSLAASDGDPNTFTGTLMSAQPGTWHAWASKPGFDGPPPSTDFRVQAARRELLVRDIDRDGLSMTAKATRGRFYTPATASRLTSELPRGRTTVIERGRPIAIWNRPELLLVMISLLATEWFLRKRARLI